MTLSDQSAHAGHRSYVVKLHRDAGPAAGVLRGRIENLATGRRHHFADGQGLLEALAADLAQAGAAEPPALPD